MAGAVTDCRGVLGTDDQASTRVPSWQGGRELSTPLYEVIRRGLNEAAGFHLDKAEQIALAVIEWGADEGLSGEYYWPVRVVGIPTEERDEAIRKEFDGTNLKSITEKFQVSKATVYRALLKKQSHFSEP